MVFVRNFFCCRLRTAALVAAWLHIIALIIGIIALIVVLYALRFHAAGEEFQIVANLVAGMVAVGIVLLAVTLTLAVRLLIGITKSKPEYMLPWIVLNALGFVLMFLALVSSLMAVFKNGAIGQFVVSVIVDALVLYLYLVIVSYYQTLKAEIAGETIQYNA